MRLKKRDGHLSSNSVFKDRSGRACWVGKPLNSRDSYLTVCCGQRGESDEVLLGKIGPGREAFLVVKEILTYLISPGDENKCGSFLVPRYIGEKYINLWC